MIKIGKNKEVSKNLSRLKRKVGAQAFESNVVQLLCNKSLRYGTQSSVDHQLLHQVHQVNQLYHWSK